MSFDGVLLHKLIKEFNILKSGRISKIIESGDTDFIFTIRSNHQNHFLMLSFSSDFARIHLTTKQYDSPANPKSLTMFLRKHIEGYFIDDIKQYENDRILYFKLCGYNEMRDFSTKYLICEIMGRYSNLILTDDSFKILEVLKKEGVSEYGRTMLPNAIYEFPKSTKLNPFNYNEINEDIHSPKDMCNTFEGISMLMATYCFKNDNVLRNLKDILDIEISPCIILNEKGKRDFYYTPLNYEVIKSYSSISELLDNYYYEADNQAKIKLKTNDLLNFIKRQINKNEKKIKKLEADIIEANRADEYRVLGELLLSYPNLKTKETKVSIFNYYTNEYILIPLDKKYDIITNSQKYYKKYQKSKSAIYYINEQLTDAKNEIEYFTMLTFQLEKASINDALEIRQELIDNKYLLNQEQHKNKKKQKPNFTTYIVDDTYISVGKNNLQNEYITHKLAKSNEYWFHVKDASGSHVVVHSDVLTENIIRIAANLAANFSSLSQSSSVPVDYTLIKNIKKIPGKKSCFVSYSKQKTIYIDPDKNLVESLRIKR